VVKNRFYVNTNNLKKTAQKRTFVKRNHKKVLKMHCTNSHLISLFFFPLYLLSRNPPTNVKARRILSSQTFE
jgi:hypothetical protein